MASFSPQPRVQRGFEPENEGYIAPREQSPYLAALFRYTSAVNAMDFDAITEVFDTKLVHSILPSSLQRPVLGYDQYFKYLDDVTEMFLEFRVNLSEIIEENHKMTVQMCATGKGRSQRKYVNETILIVHFEKVSSRDHRKYGSNGGNWPPDALPKMVNVREFVDSISSKTWFKEERQWMKENAGIVAEQRARREGEWRKDRWRHKQSLLQSQGASAGYLGQPTQFAQGSSGSPTSGYQYAYPSPFPPGGFTPPNRSQGHSPTTSRGYGPPLSTSLGTPTQSYSLQYARSSSGYPSSYHPQSKDKYGGS